MVKFGLILVLLCGLAVIGAGLYLAYGNFPAPTTQVERVLPNDRFTK